MKIGNIDLGPRPVLLAPMEDVTDASFRKVCRECGADLSYTEFISSDGLIRDAAKSIAKMRTSEEEAPIGIQIYGNDPEAMVRAAQMADRADEIAGGHGCDLIDINFGCPVSKIAGRGAGSGMMREPDKMVAITRAIVGAVRKPVTVKTRLGWDEGSKIIVELAPAGRRDQRPDHPRPHPLPDVQRRGRLDPHRLGKGQSPDAHSRHRQR